MGIETIALAGLAAAGTFSSVQQAQKQNKAVKRSEEAARTAASVQARQLSEQEQQQREQRIQESRRLRASILAAGGASGFDLSSGDFADAVSASDAYASQDLNTLAANLQSNLDRVYSGLDSQLISIGASKQNVAGAALNGGLAGVQTGLSLSQSFDTIFNARTRQEELIRIRNSGGTQGGFPVT